MMISILALATALASVLLMAGSLRMVAQDTFAALSDMAQRARVGGNLRARVAFAALWVLIFALSYM
ncbi:hypothetical protein KB874_15980 [Aestuariicoccus sp. KMU-90]|uniref:Uncharacterized protein n=2 Tax=Thetidibacter halocola TaxID=2827239 RepID=A0A8J7WH64_9RHOB|nr:hypothetical protein [Thetidibacter halocola]